LGRRLRKKMRQKMRARNKFGVVRGFGFRGKVLCEIFEVVQKLGLFLGESAAAFLFWG
jgi:hypothetical protein